MRKATAWRGSVSGSGDSCTLLLDETKVVASLIVIGHFTGRVSLEVTAIGSTRPFVRLFPLYLLNRLTFELEFVCVCVCVDHDRGIIAWYRKSRS